MADKTERPNPTTELRVMISEGPDGNMLVEHEALIKGTTTIVKMRPSHIAGQLMSAAVLVLAKEFENVRGIAAGRGRKKE
jgi:hypothetical protein